MTTEEYENVPEPQPTDGPQEPVDDEELDDETHPRVPGDADHGDPE